MRATTTSRPQMPGRASSLTLERGPARAAILHPGRWPYVVGSGLVVAATASAGFSLFVPTLLSGEAAIDGNLRGTGLVVLAVGVPLVTGGMLGAARGSARWLTVWLGATFYLLYQAVMFCFATPFNSLFLAYVAMLGLGLFGTATLWHHVSLDGFTARIDAGMPSRWLPGVLITVVTLNALAWLARIVPALFDENPASVLDGSGLLTSPGWVQDLAFWIPLGILAGASMWAHRPAGILLSGAMLALYTVESLSIASDQWWGSRADAGHPELASAELVVPFVVVALLMLVPLLAVLRHLDHSREPVHWGKRRGG